MTNRTDWPELARELQDIFGFNGEARRRIETELHNAFVAGQGRLAGSPASLVADAVFPGPDSLGCTCLKDWKEHVSGGFAARERVITKTNPACPKHQNPHIIDGEFQSDKYPSCPRGKVPLSTKDPAAQDLLAIYAERRRIGSHGSKEVDPSFADAVDHAIRKHGYVEQRLVRSLPLEVREWTPCTGHLVHDAFTPCPRHDSTRRSG